MGKQSLFIQLLLVIYNPAIFRPAPGGPPLCDPLSTLTTMPDIKYPDNFFKRITIYNAVTDASGIHLKFTALFYTF